jgi:RNA polymerase sigma-70 factor (ECF subfamily)
MHDPSHDQAQRSDEHAEQEFQRLLQRTAQGDQAAATELVQKFETEVRRFIRIRLANSQLRQIVDSVDICQSVLGQFFVELEGGRLRLESPKQLRNLLLKMAQNKLFSKGRYQRAAKRDVRRTEYQPAEMLSGATCEDETPSVIVSSAELAELIRAKLPDDTRYLIEQRLSGREWGELAAELGMTADAARKRMTRALDEVAGELGLIDP